MSTFELIDESFDKDCCENYELSIRTSLNGFSFAIKDTIRCSFIVLVDYTCPVEGDNWPAALDALFTAYPWLRNAFKRVLFSFNEAPYTLVPQEVFSEVEAKNILSLTNDVPSLYEIHYQKQQATSPESVVIFALPSVLASEWLDAQRNTIFVAPVAQFNPKSCIGIGSEYLFIEAGGNSFTIVSIKNELLSAINTFSYTTATDFAYYTLGFCNSLGLNSSSAGLKLVGEVAPEIADLLNCYFGVVSTDLVYTNTLFSYRLMKYRARYFGLFNLSSQCV